MANSCLTNIHTWKIITENVIFHNLSMSKYVQQKKNMSLYRKINEIPCHANLIGVDHLVSYNLQKGWVIISVEIS